MLRQERIDEPQPEAVDIATPEFRRAALARIVQYTVAFGAAGFPQDLPAMKQRQEEQAARELETWQGEWLPNVLRPVCPGESPCSNVEVFEDY